MLLETDCDLDELRLIDKQRIESLALENDVPAYVTTVRLLEDVEENTSLKLDRVLRAFGRQVALFTGLFSSREWRRHCDGNGYRTLRDRLVGPVSEYLKAHPQNTKTAGDKSPDTSKVDSFEVEIPGKEPGKPVRIRIFGLPARLWKLALQQASITVANDWRLAQQRAKERIEKTDWFRKLNEAERHYVYLLLFKLNDDFFDLMDGRTPTFKWHSTFNMKKVRHASGLCVAVRRAVRAEKTQTIRHAERRSVWFDCSCYTVKTEKGKQIVELMTLEKGKRAKIVLRGKKKISGTIKLVKTSTSWTLHTLAKPKPKLLPQTIKEQNGKLVCVAMDMGFTEVYTLDDGSQYGEGFGKAIREEAELLARALEKRSRLLALANNTQDKKKRRHILTCNLGSKKIDRAIARHKLKIRNIVNRALNRIFEEHPAHAYIVEELGRRFELQGFTKATNRALSSWIRGFIEERLCFKAAIHGMKIVKVPSAYGSQRCPYCGCVHSDSRKGDRFKCVDCGREAHADKVACLNLLCRVRDCSFKARMPKEAVLALELKEYRAQCDRRGTEPVKYVPRQSRRPTKTKKSQQLSSLCKPNSASVCTRHAMLINKAERISKTNHGNTCKTIWNI